MDNSDLNGDYIKILIWSFSQVNIEILKGLTFVGDFPGHLKE